MPTVLDTSPRTADPTGTAVLRAAYADRAFPTSQELLAGTGSRALPGPTSVSWHDLGLSPYRGAFAYVQDGRDDLLPLLGKVLRVTVGPRFVYVFVVGTGLIQEDVSLARRAYLALAPLNVDPLQALVEVAAE